MANLLYQQIEMLSREKHIEPEVVISAIEDAMVVAARKYYKTEEDLRGKFNAESGQVDVYSVYTVVEEVADPKREISVADAKKKNPGAEVGTEILTAKPTDVLGRIAAQTAKQVILQKVREAERDTIFNEYHNRAGELVTVIVKRAEGPDLIVDMGRTEARLPKREQSKLETYNIGERIRGSAPSLILALKNGGNTLPPRGIITQMRSLVLHPLVEPWGSRVKRLNFWGVRQEIGKQLRGMRDLAEGQTLRLHWQIS